MRVVTKDYQDIECKFIVFEENNLCITLENGTEIFEELKNINYIKQS